MRKFGERVPKFADSLHSNKVANVGILFVLADEGADLAQGADALVPVSLGLGDATPKANKIGNVSECWYVVRVGGTVLLVAAGLRFARAGADGLAEQVCFWIILVVPSLAIELESWG